MMMINSVRSTTRPLLASTRASTSTQCSSYSTASKARPKRLHRIPRAADSPSVTTTAPLPRVSHPTTPPRAVPHVDSATRARGWEIDQGKGKGKAQGTATEDAPYDLSRRGWEEPPLVAAARAKTTRQRSIWESYLVLDPTTRLLFSLGLGAFALLGLYAGDWLVPEEKEVAAEGEEEVRLKTASEQGAGGQAKMV